MAELKIYDQFFPFKCDNPECDEEYDLEGFIDVALLWGFIYLTDKQHDLFGITCPDCFHTTLRKYPVNIPDFSIEILERQANGPNIKYFVPFSPKILADLALIEAPRLLDGEKLSDSYQIPFGFEPRVYSRYAYDEYRFFIGDRVIPELLEIENNQKYKVFPRIVEFNSIYAQFDQSLIEFDHTNIMSEDYLTDIDTSVKVLIELSYRRTLGSEQNFIRTTYDHMIHSDLSEELYKDLDISNYWSWQRDAFQKNINAFIEEYKRLRNRIDFELICYSKLINKFARLFYYEKGLYSQMESEWMSHHDAVERGELLPYEDHPVWQEMPQTAGETDKEKLKPEEEAKTVPDQIKKGSDDIEKTKSPIGFINKDVALTSKAKQSTSLQKSSPLKKSHPPDKTLETSVTDNGAAPERLETAEGKIDQIQSDKKNEISNEEISLEDYKARTEEVLELNEKYLSLEKIRTINPDMMKKKIDIADKAKLNIDILIYGETGTGKELFAKAIHEIREKEKKKNGEKTGKYHRVNCSAIPDNLIEDELFGHEKGGFTGAIKEKLGAFQIANNGTLFLDEFAKMRKDVQDKILIAIDSKEFIPVGSEKAVNVQLNLIYGANESLESKVERGEISKDLYYRVKTHFFEIPRLRDRFGDVPLLADHFRIHFNEKFNKNVEGFEPNVIDTLKKYIWPGNVRDLKGCIERAIANSKNSLITKKDLLPELQGEDFPKKEKKEDKLRGNTKLKKFEIIYWLDKENSVKGAADKLGIDRRTIYRHLEGIDPNFLPPDFAPQPNT
jgi:transcriptional regulator with PAS, ATPase and Fis domain